MVEPGTRRTNVYIGLSSTALLRVSVLAQWGGYTSTQRRNAPSETFALDVGSFRMAQTQIQSALPRLRHVSGLPSGANRTEVGAQW